jgi:hypothetical protein
MDSQVVTKLVFHEVDYGKGFFILHIAYDDNNGQLYKLVIF